MYSFIITGKLKIKSKEPQLETIESGYGDGGDNVYSLNSLLSNVYHKGWYFLFNFPLDCIPENVCFIDTEENFIDDEDDENMNYCNEDRDDDEEGDEEIEEEELEDEDLKSFDTASLGDMSLFYFSGIEKIYITVPIYVLKCILMLLF